MADRISKEQRSRNMAAVKNKNTKPEIKVRSHLHKHGFRFRLHDKNLPGKPDIILKKYKTVIFIHGCFWHGHNCKKGKLPATNTAFWKEKIGKNVNRDKKATQALQEQGWKVLTVWECEISDSYLDNFITLNFHQ
ncbi:MAG: very short patch repair endonuclease [Micavibrio sp.]|jgi:DNA mismatch endonuclease (patch repair protein)|nr:very short patch repair endonuclease [Micavibrio sp.]|tara:strand:+ start:1276 stop:1680 length:405 start_codon:yes stop_codon:yes gene_type:complete